MHVHHQVVVSRQGSARSQPVLTADHHCNTLLSVLCSSQTNTSSRYKINKVIQIYSGNIQVRICHCLCGIVCRTCAFAEIFQVVCLDVCEAVLQILPCICISYLETLWGAALSLQISNGSHTWDANP